MSYDAIINPIPGRNSPKLGRTAIMAAAETDYRALIGKAAGAKQEKLSLMMSRVCLLGKKGVGTAVVGPIVGAPYAVILLENLIAWGVRKVIFFGWCGSLAPEVKIGDILLPTSAYIDEGTSPHYNGHRQTMVGPDNSLMLTVSRIMTEEQIHFHQGKVWTTDAVFRETPEKVLDYQKKGALGVEMETSALFTVGRFRGIAVGAVLVVSDELFSLKWHTGFKDTRFLEARRKVRGVLPRICDFLLQGSNAGD